MVIKTFSIKKLQEDILSISKPFILISIRSISSLPKPTIPQAPLMEDALYLTFIDDDNLQSNDPGLFSEKQAQEIKYFVDKYKNVVNFIAVQCQMGESRSTAIASILELYFNHDNKASKRYKTYYNPNKRVYEIMSKIFLNQDEE